MNEQETRATAALNEAQGTITALFQRCQGLAADVAVLIARNAQLEKEKEDLEKPKEEVKPTEG